MNARQLTLLSPYRLPTESTLYMGDEEIAAILNGFSALWHPAALIWGSGLPRLVSPYDHEEPTGDQIFGYPENPPLNLPEDWHERAGAAGALVFTATLDRDETFRNLFEALAGASTPPVEGDSEPHSDYASLKERSAKLAAIPIERFRPFLGIGLGCLILDALFEAMSHENVLPMDELANDVFSAITAMENDDDDLVRQHLQSAADRLLSAREVVYPVTLHLVDLCHLQLNGDLNFPAAYDAGLPFNLIASGSLIDQLNREKPEVLAELREKVAGDLVEVLGGPWCEREDPLFPLESQIWNLVKGQRTYQDLLGTEVRVFARKKTGFHAQLPLFLQNVGIGHALLVTFDDAMIPSHHTVVVSWPSHNGKQVESFTRTPLPADSPQTYFHLAHHLHQTIMQDQSATMVLIHGEKQACPWYDDWLELTRFAPVLGKWTTMSSYFGEVISGDYTSAVSPDEFHIDYLASRTQTTYADEESPQSVAPTDVPISGFVAHVRDRRLIDSGWTFAAVLRSLRGTLPEIDGQSAEHYFAQLEDRFETGQASSDEIQSAVQSVASALTSRLVASGSTGSPGYMLLNPCSFPRRVAVELPGISGPLPITGAVKGCQMEGEIARVVVELPPLGYAWLPRNPTGAAAQTTRMKLADDRCVRNEFFEAEIDLQTGGLKGIRDQRFRLGRLGQQLVYNPGSQMQAKSVQVLSTGPALGEVLAEGVILDEQGAEIAGFKQRFRAWLGRPLLEMRIEIVPKQPLEGYPWHAYFASRFAWRDENATLLRGCSGLRAITSQTRPESGEFLEIRIGRPNTVVFPSGLPFHQRHGGRMLDVLLLCEGEKEHIYELGIGLDREQPMQTALGLVSPVAVVATEQGPPRSGATGWLALLDASNVMLSSLRPTLDHPDGIIATLSECAGSGGPASFRFVRDPVRAVVQDLNGISVLDADIRGDAVELEICANDLTQLRVEFS